MQRGDDLVAPLVLVGAVFVPLQVLSPIHQAIGANLGSRTAAWLYDRLTSACVRPPGMGHLESPKLTSDLTMARDFDLGITGPPMSISMDFIASGLVEMVAGLASAAVLAGYAWWAPLVLAGAWLATHWLLRESGVWRDRNTEEVREAAAPCRLRLPTGGRATRRQGASALRAGGLDRGPLSRAARRLFELRWEATRLRERPVLWSLLLVLAANIVVFWSMAIAAADGALALDRVVTYATAALMTSTIAFGGLSWALDGAAAPVAAVLRLEEAMDPAGSLVAAAPEAAGRRACRRGRSVFATSASPTPPRASRCSTGFDLTIPAGSSLAIVGQNGAGKTTLAKLLCRLYDPQARRHRGRRRRSPRARPRCLAVAAGRGVSGLHSIRAAAARQRGTGRRAG